MHVRTGRALHASAQTEPMGEATYELEVVQLDPRDGAWLLDKPPLTAEPAVHAPRRVGGPHRPGARALRKGLTDDDSPQEDHRRPLSHRRDPARGSSTTSSTRSSRRSTTTATPSEFIKNHLDEFKIERALTMSNYGVPVHEISFDLNDVVMDAATTNDRVLAAIWVSFLPAQRRDDPQGAEARRRVARRRAEDDVPPRRQPRSRGRGTRRPWHSPTSASTPARSTT